MDDIEWKLVTIELLEKDEAISIAYREGKISRKENKELRERLDVLYNAHLPLNPNICNTIRKTMIDDSNRASTVSLPKQSSKNTQGDGFSKERDE